MRARLVGLAVLVLAVALGITLGAGPLQSGAGDDARARRDAERTAASRAATIADLRAANKAGEAYAAATAAGVLRGRLTGRTVALVSLPDSDPAVVTALASRITAAGGTIGAQVRLADELFTGNAGLLDALTSQMLTAVPGLNIGAGATPYQRAGVLLARAIAVPPSAQVPRSEYDAPAISIVSGLETAKMISAATVTARSGLTLVVGAARTSTAGVAAQTALLEAYGAQVLTVATAPSASARPGGMLAALRAATPARLSTVDGAESSYGQVAGVLALAARVGGVLGSYGGTGAADGVVPPGP